MSTQRVLVVLGGDQATERTTNLIRGAGYELHVVRRVEEAREILLIGEPLMDAVVCAGLPVPKLAAMQQAVNDVEVHLSLLILMDEPSTVTSILYDSEEVLVRGSMEVTAALRFCIERTALRRRNRFLEARLSQVAREPVEERIRETQDVAIFGLAKLVESRDSDTGAHLERMAEYSRILAQELRNHPVFGGYVDQEYVWDIWRSAPLHDIGKVGVPDAILLKPGKLDADEWAVMQTHSVVGGDTLREIESRLHYRSFLQMGRDIAYCHHEKWSGEGYPFGLRGEEIPLSARIVALADVYDALTSKRPYKEPFSHEKATSIVLEGRASHFDPVICDTFLRVQDAFIAVATRHPQHVVEPHEGLRDVHKLEVARYRRKGRRMKALWQLVEGQVTGERQAAPGVP
jgi:response regulator RpfG family c-di-GMP phosphodiesterase